MSTPLITPDDLDTYLGLGGSIDTARATQIIQWAHDKCESVVSPVPLGAASIEADVAARSYTNPGNSVAALPEPLQTGGSTLGGIWLTKANIQELRRLAPSTVQAFSITPFVEDFSDA